MSHGSIQERIIENLYARENTSDPQTKVDSSFGKIVGTGQLHNKNSCPLLLCLCQPLLESQVVKQLPSALAMLYTVGSTKRVKFSMSSQAPSAGHCPLCITCYSIVISFPQSWIMAAARDYAATGKGHDPSTMDDLHMFTLWKKS